MQPSSLGCSYLALHRDLSTFRDLNHLIWTVKIRFKRSRFDLRFDFYFFVIRFEKKGLNRDKSDACLPTQNEMHESSKHFCFGCDLMLKLHRTDIVSTVTVQSISRVIRPKMHFVKYRYLHFLLKIYLHIYFRERFETWFEISPWKISDLRKNGDLRFDHLRCC